jgi:RimJ/RimL family protein N-acetyltransferase
MIKGLYADGITLTLINDNNVEEVISLFCGFEDSEDMILEMKQNYLPEYENGIRVKYGFYTLMNDELAGMSLVGIDSLKEKKGYTGADTFFHMRGKGVAPRSKPHLFYFAFELLGLNRLATGCLISNQASKRSIEKTPGFVFEGISRESGINDKGEFEDEYLYAILLKDWRLLYDRDKVTVIT